MDKKGIGIGLIKNGVAHYDDFIDFSFLGVLVVRIAGGDFCRLQGFR
ncbi:hypothetical protein TUM4644_20050 [Shewanella colwelliana]|nr:hypothetical protein TUM4644_20050 [Shewanella colwelliana]